MVWSCRIWMTASAVCFLAYWLQQLLPAPLRLQNPGNIHNICTEYRRAHVYFAHSFFLFFLSVITAVLSNHGFANCLKLCWWIDSQTGDFCDKVGEGKQLPVYHSTTHIYQYITVPPTATSISQYTHIYHYITGPPTSTSISWYHPHLPVYHSATHIYQYITVPPTATSILQYHQQLLVYHSTTNSYQYITVLPQLSVYHSTATATSISQ